MPRLGTHADTLCVTTVPLLLFAMHIPGLRTHIQHQAGDNHAMKPSMPNSKNKVSRMSHAMRLHRKACCLALALPCMSCKSQFVQNTRQGFLVPSWGFALLCMPCISIGTICKAHRHDELAGVLRLLPLADGGHGRRARRDADQ